MEKHTVSELNTDIRKTLRSKYGKNNSVIVHGEISNLKTSGRHTFLTLKDDSSAIQGVFWNEHFDGLKNGDDVDISGKIDYYVKSGYINLIGSSIEKKGIGELHQRYGELFKKYKQLGYCDNKKPLPEYVNSIGVITAAKGAALQDMLYVLKKDNFRGDVYIYNCSAQGPNCPRTVAKGIKFFNSKNNKVDVIIVTRGGGSFEDLMGFSDPVVIEAMHKSKIYTISAIGHEIDNMLSDYVANYRAPTPSIAGEVISGIYAKKFELMEKIEENVRNMEQNLYNKIKNYANAIMIENSRITDKNTIVCQKLDYMMDDAFSHLANKIKIDRGEIYSIEEDLGRNDTINILKKGYLLITDDGNIVKSIDTIVSGKKLKLIHHTGTYYVKISKYSN